LLVDSDIQNKRSTWHYPLVTVEIALKKFHLRTALCSYI
jgi:hypothetical protein